MKLTGLNANIERKKKTMKIHQSTLRPTRTTNARIYGSIETMRMWIKST